MENRRLKQVIENIEINIEKCDILKNLLKATTTGDPVDYNWYYKKGYSETEINVGVELINLYLQLKSILHGLG